MSLLVQRRLCVCQRAIPKRLVSSGSSTTPNELSGPEPSPNAHVCRSEPVRASLGARGATPPCRVRLAGSGGGRSSVRSLGSKPPALEWRLRARRIGCGDVFLEERRNGRGARGAGREDPSFTGRSAVSRQTCSSACKRTSTPWSRERTS
ncbi:hypothetical protein MHYP_G00181160 [Metynnis hypsauchen]